ncbi:MAG: SH3 domain-containing protein, partial [Gemmatimonadales bacterium]
WAALAGLAWLAFWLLAPAWPRRRLGLILLGAVSLGAGAAAAIEWRRRARPVGVVVVDTAAVRAAPYGTASATATLQAGGAVLTGSRHGAWREVRRPDGVRGWVLASEIVPL